MRNPIFLLTAITPLLFSGGCWCFPSIRYRDPASPNYHAACACGRADCAECLHRQEAVKPVPWPKFHPVPTHPVYGISELAEPRYQRPLSGDIQLESPHGRTLPMEMDPALESDSNDAIGELPVPAEVAQVDPNET